MNIKTFLVSLEREKARRAKVVHDLERLGLDYSIFNAVDGYSLTDKELKELCDVGEIKNKSAWFTKGLIGCCLSHYMLYKKIIAEDLPYAFIIEDDVKLSDNIRELLVKAVEFISKDEVILFYYQSDGIQCPLSNINSKVLVGKFKLHYPMLGNLNCTGAYLITKEACLALTKIIPPIRVGADDWSFFLHNGLKSLRLVYPRPIGMYDFRSTISDSSNFSKSLALKTINVINQYKIFPFYQLLVFRRKLYKIKLSDFVLVNLKSAMDNS